MNKLGDMKVAFRVDASLDIGSGHVMRCLTLADGLRSEGVDCSFICREHTGNLLDFIREKGYRVYSLPLEISEDVDNKDASKSHIEHEKWLATSWHTDASQTCSVIEFIHPDWLIVDHYALDEHWESVLRESCTNIMVIDDLVDRPHDCDLLLDQTLGRTAEEYVSLTPEHCIRLTGTDYALLRPEFAALRDYSLKRRQQPKLTNLLISMGGVDQHNATGKVLDSLKECPLPPDCHITVVMGLQSPWLETVKRQADTMPWPTEVRVNVLDMARLMSESDFAIGAAGTTTWERCCLGLPSLIAVLADNQEDIASAINNVGAAIDIGEPKSKCFKDNIVDAIINFITNIKYLQNMSSIAAKVTNGLGVIKVNKRILGEELH